MIAPFLQRTRQGWKPIVGGGLICLGLLVIGGWLGGWWGKLSGEAFVALVGGANALNLAAFVWMVRAIRCPKCGVRLFWHALQAKPDPAGLHWFLSFEACPHCHFEPRGAANAGLDRDRVTGSCDAP